MTIGEIIFAVMVGFQGVLFLVGAIFISAFLITKKSSKFYVTAFLLWALAPIFSIIGVFFGVFI